MVGGGRWLQGQYKGAGRRMEEQRQDAYHIYPGGGENKGKYRTLVDAVNRAGGEWFLIADSDDEFVPETIDIFLKAYDAIPDEVKPRVSGVTGLVIDSLTREVVGGRFPIEENKGYMLTSVNELIYKMGVTGEKWGILKTAVMQEFAHQIEVPQNVKYIGEQALWSPIGEKYMTIFINEPLRIYYQGTSDTLSSRNIAGRHPLGAWITERKVLPCIARYFWNRPKMVLFSCVKLNYASLLCGKNYGETVKGFGFWLKCLMLLTRSVGFVAQKRYPATNSVAKK